MDTVYYSNSGCSIHSIEFSRFLAKSQLVQTYNINQADVIIQSFCGISSDSFKEIPYYMAVIKHLVDTKPSLRVFVGGCAEGPVSLAERYPFITGVFRRGKMVEDLEGFFSYDGPKDPLPTLMNSVLIQTGCSRHCGFCKRAYMDMPLISTPVETVMSSVESAVKSHHPDIVLLAENSTEYGIDLPGNTRLIDLLKSVSKVDGVKSIFLSALCIDELVHNQELIDYIANSPLITKIQLEIQSLIPAVRKNMRLTSSVNDVLRILDTFRNKCIITNIMVGYPGETDSSFRKQLDLIRSHHLYFVQFNVYDNTPTVYGATLPQVPKSTSDRRLLQLVDTIHELKEKQYSEWLGQTLPCIYTSSKFFELTTGRAIVVPENRVVCPVGTIVNVRITGLESLVRPFDNYQYMILKGVIV